jgi:glycosidase
MYHAWWKKAVFYEIYVPSFKDGNGDGIGDFAGITSKLDYLKELGIDGLWLTPFYPSPKVDNGYDISDYFGIDPSYGTMEEFESFLIEAHKRGIRVIADLVLNHTSSEHQWFKESRSSRDNPKRDWYIWKDQPNNWESFFSGPAWEFDEATGQYYYHAFAKEQVDLNWANPELRQVMFNVMRFWLEKGVDGFRLDVINFLKVQDSFPNNPYDHDKKEQIHLHDKDQEGIMTVIREISEVIHQYPDKFIVGEVGSEEIDILKNYLGTGKLDVAFNFNIGSIGTFDVEQLYSELLATEEAYGLDQNATLFFSSHDMPRFISRFGGDNERAKLFAALMLTAKGVPFIYQGDEIGMQDWLPATLDAMRDVQGKLVYEKAMNDGLPREEAFKKAVEGCRDKSRTPMQWDASLYAGFSESEPWITIPSNSVTVNVENQMNDPGSMLSFYHSLLKLRKCHRSLQSGEYEILQKQDDMIFFTRSAGQERVLVALNFSSEDKTIDVQTDRYDLLLSNKRTSLINGNRLEVMPNEAMILVKSEEKINSGEVHVS